MKPGVNVEEDLALVAPLAPGDYLLMLDIVTPDEGSLVASGTSSPPSKGHTLLGGCTHCPHPRHRRIKSSPFAPPVQNGRFSGVSGGSIRGVGSDSTDGVTRRTIEA
jgi:hypothetical protein